MTTVQAQNSHLALFSMDLRGHDAFLDVDDSGIFGGPDHEFSFSHTPVNTIPHNPQGVSYGYTDASAVHASVDQARDRSGYPDVVKQIEPRSTDRTGLEQRMAKIPPPREPTRAQPSSSQQLLKDGVRNVRRLQSLEHRLEQRISYLEGRMASLESR